MDNLQWKVEIRIRHSRVGGNLFCSFLAGIAFGELALAGLRLSACAGMTAKKNNCPLSIQLKSVSLQIKPKTCTYSTLPTR